MEGYTFPPELRYTPSHLWVKDEQGEAMIGLTQHGQERHGRIYYVGLPALGAPVAFGMPFGYLQSAGYGLTQLFPPVQGEVIAINEALWAEPHLVNDDPLGRGWLVAIRMANAAELDELEDGDRYEAILRAGDEARHPRLPRELLNSPQPAFLIDERRRVLTCNAAAERLIGLSVREMRHGPLCSELFGCHADDADGTPIAKASCPGLCSMMNVEPVTQSYVVTNATGGETHVDAEYLPVVEPGLPRRAVVVLKTRD